MSRVVSVQGRAVPVVGDDIDTDRIIPARYLKEITFSRMGEYPFYDERFNPDGSKKDHPFNKPEYQGASVLIGNVNFGCGSSREHAPQSLVRWGIRAVIAESFAEIFAGNCIMLGTPALIASKDDVLKLQKVATDKPGTVFTIDLNTMEVKADGLTVKVTMPPSRRNALVEGTWDSTALLLANAAKTKEKAGVLPHPSGRMV
jgi:3-isopropylmalate/(R)-2-methylmalate dehydratase small subunit